MRVPVSTHSNKEAVDSRLLYNSSNGSDILFAGWYLRIQIGIQIGIQVGNQIGNQIGDQIAIS
jgi:hypothetical protein